MNSKMITRIIVAVLSVVLIAVLLFLLLGDPTVDVSNVNKIKVYGTNLETGASSYAILSSDDTETVINIFNGKSISSDNPDDVFSEKYAFCLSDGDTEHFYCLAQDGSNIIYSANDNKYFNVSAKEMETLVDLVDEYCG